MISQEMMNYTHSVPAPRTMGRVDTVDISRSLDFRIPYLKYLLLAMLASLGFLMVYSQYIGSQYYEMQQLRKEIVALERSNELSRLEVARLASLSRIQKVAETELGMHVAETAIYGKQDFVIDQSRIRD